ncbi:MerR family transcriptional regulator [Amycolatopsis coloradensis]|uniref:MerR family transcriptional regulator n=1 Tax=Amycolatopsis coloradensis TaxID=76021 RepID=A0A1R0KH54_9PSEU|nr:MerR family transcriptional regulator [Amycolatopsis coloradensis]OLZ45007.1 MerR family transcriptional regulator [Amycolatopsis coloradensis]
MHYSISEVARYFGIAVSALRYYDQVGLLHPAGRRGTVRVYGRDELRRLALVQLLHHDGMMSLADTTATLTDNPPSGRARHVVAESIRVMQHQIERLRAAQHVLEHLLTCPRDDPIRDCPVLRTQLEDTVDTALGANRMAEPDSGSPPRSAGRL